MSVGLSLSYRFQTGQDIDESPDSLHGHCSASFAPLPFIQAVVLHQFDAKEKDNKCREEKGTSISDDKTQSADSVGESRSHAGIALSKKDGEVG